MLLVRPALAGLGFRLFNQHRNVSNLPKAVSDASGHRRDERDALLAEWTDGDRAIAMLNWYRATPLFVPAIGEVAALPPIAASDFPQLLIPTLLIWAMDDLALPAANIIGIEALVPNLTLQKVYGCGHFVTWQAAGEVNSAMDRFLMKTRGIAI